MSEKSNGTAGPRADRPPDHDAYGFPPEAFDWTRLPDVDADFLPPEHIDAFIQALSAPDPIPHTPDDAAPSRSTRGDSPGLSRDPNASGIDLAKRAAASSLTRHDEDRGARETAAAVAAAADVAAPGQARPPLCQQSQRPPEEAGQRRPSGNGLFITAQHDWAPVHEKVLRDRDRDRDGNLKKSSKKTKQKKKGSRSKDETREGYLYSLLKWPFLLGVLGWILTLSFAYLLTRTYIYLYEQFVTWRGRREQLRRAMRATTTYRDWVAAAKKMDDFFGNEEWKEEDEFAYYDSKTVRRVLAEMRRCRERAERGQGEEGRQAVEDLRALVEACVKNNFVGVENPRLYSQTYYGTKHLVQNFIDEGENPAFPLSTVVALPRPGQALSWR